MKKKLTFLLAALFMCMQAALAQDTWPTITGVVVTADDGDPIMGVSVSAVGTKESFITDINGNFVIKNLPASVKTLRVSCVGMETQTLVIAKLKIGKKNKIVLKTDKSLIDEVVVTGLYTRKKESFTGSSQTYKAEELKNVGNLNLIQSLKTLDPAFNVLESNEFGSDPNRLPDLEVRGKTSIVGLKETFGQDPNQPLFILDGFETTLQTIMDLSMDRIASVTILKDAASTAIYGSKAANGVIVVETKAPQMGKLKVSYSGNYNISFADLTDYNLMNAAEKLEFERLSGYYTSNIADQQEAQEKRYNRLLQNVLRGVNTYWMSEPLRTGFNQRHYVSAEGGNGCELQQCEGRDEEVGP